MMIRSLVFTFALLGLLGMPQLGAAATHLTADGTQMRFTLIASAPQCPDCLVINASGEITDQTSRDFATFVAGLKDQGLLPIGRHSGVPQPRVILGFESPGGKVLSALVMGRRIRELGWTTLVGQAEQRDGRLVFASAGCYSACSMVMLGGVERLVVPRSKPGIHQFSPLFGDRESFSAPQMNEILRDYGRQVVTVYDYVNEMGADVSFFIETMRTPFTGMDVLPEAQWTKLGVATRLLPNRPQTVLTDVLRDDEGSVPVASLTEPKAVEAPLTDAQATGKPEAVRFSVETRAQLVPSLLRNGN